MVHGKVGRILVRDTPGRMLLCLLTGIHPRVSASPWIPRSRSSQGREQAQQVHAVKRRFYVRHPSHGSATKRSADNGPKQPPKTHPNMKWARGCTMPARYRRRAPHETIPNVEIYTRHMGASVFACVCVCVRERERERERYRVRSASSVAVASSHLPGLIPHPGPPRGPPCMPGPMP